MAYATVAQIQGEFKGNPTFSASTTLTDTSVGEFIDEADALIDSYVGMRYQVPITSGQALTLMRLYSRSLTVARCKKIMEVVQAAPTEPNQNVRSVLLSYDDVLKALKAISKGEMTLSGATVLSSGGGFSSYNVSEEVEPVFKKDEQQW